MVTARIWLPHVLITAGAVAMLADAPVVLRVAPLLALALDAVLARSETRPLLARQVAYSWLVLAALVLAWLIGRDPMTATTVGVAHIILRTLGVTILLAARPPARANRWLFVALALSYVSLVPHVAHSHRLEGDEPYYLLIAESLRADGDVDLRNNYAQRDSLRFHDEALAPQFGDPADGARSRHDPLLAALLLPGYAIGGRAGAMITMALLAAALATLVAGAGARLAESPSAGLAAGAVVGASGPLLFYALQLWTEVPAGLFALWLFVETTRDGTPRPLRLGAAALLLTLLKIRFGLVALPLVAIALLRSRRFGARAMWLALPFVGGLAIIFAWNLYHYGQALRMHPAAHIWIDPGYLPTALSGLCLDHAYGLLPYAPYALAIAYGFGLVLRSRPVVAWTAVAAMAPYLFVLAQRTSWFGEWSPPVRYPFVVWAVAMPFLAPALAAIQSAFARLATLAGVIASVTTGIILTIQPGLGYSIYDGTGQLANRVAIAIDADVLRLLPSFKNPTLFAWWMAGLTFAAALALVWRGARDGGASRDFDVTSWLAAVPGAAVASVALTAIVVTLADRLPTHVIELEQRQIVHDGGRPEPDVYAHARAITPRTGWLHPPNTSSTAPVSIAPGKWRLVVIAKALGGDHGNVEIRFGDAVLPVAVDDVEWTQRELTATTTIMARSLTLENRSPVADIVVDRIEFQSDR